MTDKKKPELTLEEKAVAFTNEYQKLCKKYGLVHQAIPFPTNEAVIQAKLQIVRLAAQLE